MDTLSLSVHFLYRASTPRMRNSSRGLREGGRSFPRVPAPEKFQPPFRLPAQAKKGRCRMRQRPDLDASLNLYLFPTGNHPPAGRHGASPAFEGLVVMEIKISRLRDVE